MNEIILRDLRSSFGISISDYTPVSGGYLNQKWKASTNQGELLIKQYSHVRFNARKREEIEYALRRQILLSELGVRCPRVFSSCGQVIRCPDHDTSYMVMEFSEGHVETPETSTPDQMRSLGEECALMHKAFRTIPPEGVKGWPLCPADTMRALSAHCQNAASSPSDEVRALIARLTNLLKCLPGDFLNAFPQSICHEDFTGDNMLFHADRLSVFLDFDRNQYSFPAHDIGRILLSLALDKNALQAEKVKSFIEGYNRHLPLNAHETADALRLTLCIETPWWLHPACFTGQSAKPRRFAQEMSWLIENWNRLDDLLS